jgi:hypothetical protein
MVDPLKVEGILQLPTAHTIRQLQGLQGKAKFLRRFIVNYANITRLHAPIEEIHPVYLG